MLLLILLFNWHNTVPLGTSPMMLQKELQLQQRRSTVGCMVMIHCQTSFKNQNGPIAYYTLHDVIHIVF